MALLYHVQVHLAVAALEADAVCVCVDNRVHPRTTRGIYVGPQHTCLQIIWLII